MHVQFRSILLLSVLLLLASPLLAAPSGKSKAKQTAKPPQDELDIQTARPENKLFFLYRGRKMELPSTGFHAACRTYTREGVKYATPAGQIEYAWKDIDFLLPLWKEGWLVDKKSFVTEALLPASCPDAHLSVAVKKKATQKARDKAQDKPAKDEVLYALSDIQVLAFDAAGLERGMAELARKGIVYEPETGMEMLLVRGGCFEMGDIFDDPEAQENEKHVHQVCVGDLTIGRTEVTQYQWQAVMQNNPSYFNACANCPVENVSWFDVQDFLRTLKQRTGKPFRLPTEAEWEHAARSGGRKERVAGLTDTASQASVAEYAWHTANAGGHTAPVATRLPNTIGLFDLSGNVSEWLQDRYAADYYRKSPKNDPTGPEIGDHRVNRGGSWSNAAARVRTTFRDHDNASVRRNNLGFRLVLPMR